MAYNTDCYRNPGPSLGLSSLSCKGAKEGEYFKIFFGDLSAPSYFAAGTVRANQDNLAAARNTYLP